MKITGINIFAEDIPLKQPFVTSKRSISVIRDYVLRIDTDEGICGYGACAPTPVITGDTVGSILYAVNEVYAPLLVGQTVSEELLPLVQKALFHNSSPKAAVDIALYDLLSKEKGLPLYRYLGADNKAAVLETDATVSLGTPEAMVDEAKKHLSEGFTAIKVKLGGPKETDVERLTALAPLFGTDIKVRLDANQAWTVEDAVYVCAACEKLGLNIELIEQPVHYADLDGMVAVTKAVAYPILADECVFGPDEARRILKMGGCNLVNIKLMKCGGIYEALKIQKIAEEYGVSCMLGCMMEGPVSITAAAHFGAAVGIDCYDLDAPYLCKEYPIEAYTRYEGKNIYIPTEGTGLGITKIL